LPAENVGENVKALRRKALEAKGFKPSPDDAPTADEGGLQTRVSKLRKKRIATTPAGPEKPANIILRFPPGQRPDSMAAVIRLVRAYVG